MTLKTLLKEYDVSVDDIRWYLSNIVADQIMTLKDNRDELVRFVWSGQLDEVLYNMEEHWLTKMQDEMDSGLVEEARVREILVEICVKKANR